MKRLIIVYISVLIVCIPILARAETLKLCVDDRDWYPFTFAENRVAKGMHIDIVKKAFDTLGLKVEIRAYPKVRCISVIQAGEADGIISIAYDKELAKSLEFPPGADKDKESPWRIMQVDIVVVTPALSNYEYDGNMASIPTPIRTTFGDPLINQFKKLNLEVQEVKSDEQNFAKMFRDKTGCLISTTTYAEKMNADKKFAGTFKISADPLDSQSYYVAFSPKTKVSAENKKKIWTEIKKWRDDYVFMIGTFAQY